MAPVDTDRNLLFGLLALQTGMIDQGALFTAFSAWTRDKSRCLADHLVILGQLDVPRRAAVEAIADVHVQALGGDIERSLAVLAVGRSIREGLTVAGGSDVTVSLRHVGSAHSPTHDEVTDLDRAACITAGTATSSGQRFRILRPHAQGGLGAVFVALDDELHREVALKQILEKHADDPISRQRFIAEAEITGGLEHPGVVPVYGLGADSFGRPYYAMRFIKGDSLKQTIARFHARSGGERTPAAGRWSCASFCGGSPTSATPSNTPTRAGSSTVTIKPANIIVGKHGETLVVDWGLAKAIGRADRTGGRADPRPVLIGLIRDPARQRAGDAGLHEPGAGQRRAEPTWPAVRRLQPGRHSVLPPDRQTAVRGEDLAAVLAGGSRTANSSGRVSSSLRSTRLWSPSA